MGIIQFVNNYDDLSTDKGYQFKFYCDKCGNGYMSRFQPSATGTAGSLLRAAGSLFGGWASSAGDSAYEIQRTVGGKAHDSALAKAVEEGKQHFHQCSRCGKWVCPEVCWNAAAGQCEECAPDYQEELASAHAACSCAVGPANVAVVEGADGNVEPAHERVPGDVEHPVRPALRQAMQAEFDRGAQRVGDPRCKAGVFEERFRALEHADRL